MLGTHRSKYVGKSSIGNELLGQFPIRKYNSDVVLDLDLRVLRDYFTESIHWYF